ncbi:high-affinity iron permease [Tulasnella sp. 419]|nr:high-affinity iron permease [Tulasnella sp. 419]
MAGDLFSVPIFFIVFREALEASIIVSVLLSLTQQLILPVETRPDQIAASPDESVESLLQPNPANLRRRTDRRERQRLLSSDNDEEYEVDASKLVKSLQLQIYGGAAAGLFVALAIGAAFLVVWYTQVIDVFGQNEEVWEGIFCLIASILILVMALAVLRIEKSKGKWQAKLQRSLKRHTDGLDMNASEDRRAYKGRYSLFLLPFITVVREGVEAIVFIGGVSLAQPPSSIPLATAAGLTLGLLVGFLIYKSSSKTPLSIFLICSTNLLLLLGAGLFSKSAGAYERYQFNKLTGGDAAERGNGPGSYPVAGNLWHLNCCNPENKLDAKGWAVLNSLVGWSNNGSVGTVGAYITYWLMAISALVYQKRREHHKSMKRNIEMDTAEELDPSRHSSAVSLVRWMRLFSWKRFCKVLKQTVSGHNDQPL